jgi:hypothetical protein
MTRHAHIAAAIAISLSLGASLAAQEPVGTTRVTPAAASAPGWTFTPSFGYGLTYDDNISMFGVRVAEEANDDVIAMYQPSFELGYRGRHTHLEGDYSGSFLNYRTFTGLNRWDQRGKVELRREESARLKWFLRTSAAAIPSTDLIELGGIPYRHTGATDIEGRAGVEIVLGARDSIGSSFMDQVIDFDRTNDLRSVLRGGRVLESLSVWRHKMSSRLSVGTDYSFRRATLNDDAEQFSIHALEAAVDYELSSAWTFSGGAGAAYLESTAFTASRTGPAWRASLDWRRNSTSFHAGYIRSFIPSFGFGGTIQNEEAGVGFRTALFHSRRWYTDQSAVFRNDTPLTSTFEQLPLRSLRTNSAVGFAPGPWIRLEAYYARTQQTSLRAGGQLYRNRVGFQIVTSKPMRVS